MVENNISPKISIIMSTWNRAAFITETIESIRNQTYRDWELIILDDGSDDNTEDLVAKIKDDRVQFYKQERTGMVSRVKNMGIRKARYELIAFADSDDLWAPEKLKKQVVALQQYPEAGFCLTGGYNFRKPGEPVRYFYKQKEGLRFGDIFISLFTSEVAGFTQTLLFRKKCIDLSGFLDESKPFSDADFIVSLAAHYKTVILFEPLLYRRLHDANDSSEHWEKRYNEWAVVIRSYQNKKRLPGTIARNALFRLYMNYGEKCLLYRQRRKAISCFFKGWGYKPVSIVPLKKIGKVVIYSLRDK